MFLLREVNANFNNTLLETHAYNPPAYKGEADMKANYPNLGEIIAIITYLLIVNLQLGFIISWYT